MTFTTIVSTIAARINQTSTEATTRIGEEVNRYYKRITTAIGMRPSRISLSVSATTTLGEVELTFSSLEKITRVYDATSGTRRFLTKVTVDELRDENPIASDTATRWAELSATSTTITILLDATPQSAYELFADGYGTTGTLSGTQEPAFPESFHDMLVEAVLQDEYRKLQKRDLAKDSENIFKERLSDLRMWYAKDGYLKLRQGERSSPAAARSGVGGASTPAGEASYEQTGLIAFNRGTSAPFSVNSGAAKVANLDADYLDGHDSSYFATEAEIVALTARSIIAGAGLTGGGTLAADRTLAVGAGTGITVNADDVALDTSSARNVDHSAVSVIAGTGLSGGGTIAASRTLTVDQSVLKIDDFAAGDDNTDLDASTSKHGLLKKLPGGTTTFLRGDGSFAAPASSQQGVEQTFRGLHLRTSPNADVAATTVSVLGLTQWVADDGMMVDDTLANNTAVISSSGAGGLDTGSEAASTWYEIYRIRKSSDGTLNTLLHQAKDYFLDEQNTTAASNISLRSGSSITKLGQTFDTDVTGYVEFIDVKIAKVGTPTGRVWVELYATSAGAPTGAVTATSDKLDVSLVSTTAQAISFIFRTPVSLTAGTTYALAITGDFSVDASHYVSVTDNNGSVYAAGAEYQYDGATWNAAARDIWFKVYVTENDTAVTLPSGYDQKCKIGYVYNDSGSNFDPFVQIGKVVRNLDLQEVGDFTAALGTLSRISAFVPPGSVSVEILTRNTTAGNQGTMAGVPDGFGIGSNPGTLGAVGGTAPGNSYIFLAGVVKTETQGLYVFTSGGTQRVWISQYEWGS